MNIQQIKEMLHKNGGFTLSNKLIPVDSGYMVGNGKDEIITTIEELTWDVINKLRNNIDIDGHIGGWVYKGKLYIDVSIRFEHEEEARIFAINNNEIAFYNLNTHEEIKTNKIKAI